MNYLRNEEFSFRKLDDEYFIIDTHENKQAHKLNELASFIWEKCDGTNSIDQIANLVCETYDCQLDQAKADVQETIQSFLKLKLIIEQ